MLTTDVLKNDPPERDAAVARYHEVVARKPERLRARVLEARDAVEAARQEVMEAERAFEAASEPFRRGTALSDLNLPTALDRDARRSAVQGVVDAEGRIDASAQRRIDELTKRVETAKAQLAARCAELADLDRRQKETAQLRDACRQFLRDAGVPAWEIK